VTLRRPTLRATRRPGGGWSTARLLPTPKFNQRPPETTCENGVIEIFDPLKTPASTLTLRDVNLALSPDASEVGNSSRGARRLRGMLSGDGLRGVELEGWIDVQTSGCSIHGKAGGVEVSPELRDCLPEQLAAKLSTLGELRGQADLEFQVGYDPAASPALRYSVAGRLARGRIDDPRLPQTLTDIRTAFRVDNGGYTIDGLTARSGQTTVRLSGRRSGFEPASPMSLAAEIRRLELDRALLAILPQALQDEWYKYLPTGQIDADVQLAYDGRSWRRDVSVRCLNVSFTHHKFPDRLKQGRGTLELKDESLKVNLTACIGDQPVRIAAEVANPFSGSTGWFEAKGDDVQIDEALVAALPEKPREVVRSLDPHGTVNFYLRMWRSRPGEPLHQHLLLGLNRCAIRFDKFPYPLTNVRGMLEMFDGQWTCRDLEGVHDTARVTCKEGHLTPGLEGNELVLNLVGRNVPLNEDLRDALGPNIRQVWCDLRPRGVVDLTAEIRYLPEQRKFSVGVRAEPQRETASIEPVHFPYRLDHLQGVLLYRDGHVDLQHCKAEHGAVRVATEGLCDFWPDGRWAMHFTGLTVDRLRADRELIQALPERLKKALAEIGPTGTMYLRGSFDLERVGAPGEPLSSKWDVRLGLQQSDLRCGGLLVQNACGEVSLAGGFDGHHLQSRGELAFDSVNYKDFQLTQVMGPLLIDDGRVLFGSWVAWRENEQSGPVPPSVSRPPRHVTAGLFGGTLLGDGWVTLEAEPRYALRVALADADLARCAREGLMGRQKLHGKIAAAAALTGSGRTRNALSGSGEIHLSEADVYELPVMVSLLKILSIRPPDQHAFSDALISYRVEGEHIYFDRIKFYGDAISLIGTGEMDFQSAIRLTFYAQVGRGELDLPVIKQIFRGASQQLMAIHVDGTLQNPETRKEALPAVSQALQQISDELQNRK
jgi:hypothetical protein